MTALRHTSFIVGLLALAFGAPAYAQPGDPAAKDSSPPRLRSKGCIMSITHIVRDGTRHQCGYSYDQKREICVFNCNPPLRPKR